MSITFGTRLKSAWRALLGYGQQTPQAIDYSNRAAIMSLNRAMYDGIVYEPTLPYRDQILRTYCGVKDGRGRIIGHYNAARGIVDAQQNVLRGTWGKEIKPVLPDDGSNTGEKPVAKDLAEALKTIWRDSNLDTAKTRVIFLAALHGTVGLRISRQAGTERVAIQYDDPSRIFNVEEDAAGNVVSVVLKYELPHNFGTAIDPDIQPVKIVEVIDKEQFSRTIEGKEMVPDDDRQNTFGFCPYVLVRHKDNDTTFGDWAFRGLEPQIHDINWRITQQGISINRGQSPKWFLTAGGPEPSAVDTDGESSVWYVQAQAGTPPPHAEAIVPKIDHDAVMKFSDSLRKMLRDIAPVLAVNDMTLLSGLSGETIAQVLKPAEAAILEVRPGYHHGFIRALQMATSMRIDLGLSSLAGASTGDAAYKSGALAFAFADMPALPPTVYQDIQNETLKLMKTGSIAPTQFTIKGDAAAPTGKAGTQTADTANGNGTVTPHTDKLMTRLFGTTKP